MEVRRAMQSLTAPTNVHFPTARGQSAERRDMFAPGAHQKLSTTTTKPPLQRKIPLSHLYVNPLYPNQPRDKNSSMPTNGGGRTTEAQIFGNESRGAIPGLYRESQNRS